MNEKVTWILEDERWQLEDESQPRFADGKGTKNGELAMASIAIVTLQVLFFASDIMALAKAISSFGPAIIVLVRSFFNFSTQNF